MNVLISRFFMHIKSKPSKKKRFSCFLCIFTILLLLFSCKGEKQENKKIPENVVNKASDKYMPIDEKSKTYKHYSEKLKSSKNDNDLEERNKNEPPNVEKAKLELKNINNMDVIRVIADGSDNDGDIVSFKYEWAINDERRGEGDSISGFKRGDKITVKITPFDGKDFGSPKTLLTEIQNTTPILSENKKIKFDGNLWMYQIKATDPDGDTLSYSLKTAPQGMTINPNTGLIQWNVPYNFKGTVSFTVSVSDNHGGEILQSFTIEIPQE